MPSLNANDCAGRPSFRSQPLWVTAVDNRANVDLPQPPENTCGSSANGVARFDQSFVSCRVVHVGPVLSPSLFRDFYMSVNRLKATDLLRKTDSHLHQTFQVEVFAVGHEVFIQDLIEQQRLSSNISDMQRRLVERGAFPDITKLRVSFELSETLTDSHSRGLYRSYQTESVQMHWRRSLLFKHTPLLWYR
ncbi:hypothetical protein GHT06_016088 [Daphnia sinensis]|uniref:Uncharacterized protein n=1 Tax=Daphnia sinensis TaxID=1820382 RepID=A0AAD5KTK1_9CRUS|nr:hypothetical protein GHT06_016088 [Daphnia sinensis]